MTMSKKVPNKSKIFLQGGKRDSAKNRLLMLMKIYFGYFQVVRQCVFVVRGVYNFNIVKQSHYKTTNAIVKNKLRIQISIRLSDKLVEVF
jgi:hypothetical protein